MEAQVFLSFLCYYLVLAVLRELEVNIPKGVLGFLPLPYCDI